MGEVVQLFKDQPVVDTKRRRCFNCAFGIDTERGTYCDLFKEFTLTELTARDCEAFDDKENPAS